MSDELKAAMPKHTQDDRCLAGPGPFVVFRGIDNFQFIECERCRIINKLDEENV